MNGASAAAADDAGKFYLIGEIAQQVGANCSAIRFYEQEGFITPLRHGRFRVYLPDDAERLKFIITLRSFGLPLKTIHNLVDNHPHTDGQFASTPVLEALQAHRRELLRQRDVIDDQVKSIDARLACDGEDK